MTTHSSPIHLGLMSPFSGLVELYGPEISWAGQIAVDEINQSGGLLGRPLELVVADDGSLPDTAVPAANRLIDDAGCVAIIGNLLSNSRISVASMVAEPRKVPYLNFSFYEGSIWSRYFFHFAALPNQQIEKMIPYMADAFGPKMFFAGSNYEWPRGSIDAAKRSLRNHGGEVVGEAYLPFGTEEFSDLLDQLTTSGADVFVPYFVGSDQTNLLTQFTERGLKEKIAVVMGHYDEAMVGLLLPEVREGFYSSNTYFMSVDTPESHAYLKRLAGHPDVTGIWPDGNGVLTNFGEGTYVCVKAFAKAVETAGTVDREAIVDALENITINGPQGTVVMDPATHHARVNTHLSRCNANGTFDLVRSFGSEPPVIPARYRSLFPGLKENAGKSEKPERAALDNPLPLNGEPASIIHTDSKGKIIEANEQAGVLFGYPRDELVGMSVHLLLPPHLRNQHKIHFQRFVDSDSRKITRGQQGEVFGYRQDGSQFPAQASIFKARRDGVWRLIATVFDLSRKLDDESDLKRQTSRDPLTGLLNRSVMTERLTSALERSAKADSTVGVLRLDIRSFNGINERLGFDTGDQVLVVVADTLVRAAGKGSTVGRVGGDEFLIICEQLEKDCDAQAMSGQLTAAIGESLLSEGINEKLTFDIEFVKVTGGERDADQILQQLLT